jgi:hypothetical protein
MKVASVLVCCAMLGILLVPLQATAQVEDDFAGGLSTSVPWQWDVPGNAPSNTEDPTNYSFSSNSLKINVQPGSLYAGNNNAINIPNMVIVTQPDSWFVETAVSTDWSQASLDSYVQAGLIFFADADNYFSFYYTRDAANSPSVQVSSTFETFGGPTYGGISSADWTPTQDYVKLRVEGTPTQITFLFDHTGTFEVAGKFTSDDQTGVFAFFSSLEGMRVGLETDSGGGSNGSPFAFSYLKTNLAVPQTEDVFAGSFNASIPWTFEIPGDNPTDTEDPTHYAFSSNSLDITAQGGSTYAANNNAHNMPNLVVLGQPDYWYVETAISTDWSMASTDHYVHAGLVFLTDADNYYSFYYNRNAGSAPSVQVSTTIEVAASANYGNLSSGNWDPTTDPVKLRVEGTPTQVSFLFNHAGTWQMAFGSPVSATSHPDVYALVSSLVGKHVCLETDAGGGFNSSPFSFHYFKTNLKVSP